MILLKKYKFTMLAMAIGIFIFNLAFFFHYEFYESVSKMFRVLEFYEIDEIFSGLIFISIGLIIDLLIIKKQKKLLLEKERLKVLKATMVTVQDIVNNFLNNLYLFRLEADQKNAISKDSLKLLDALIRSTSQKLKTIGDLKKVREKRVADGMYGIEYEKVLEDTGKFINLLKKIELSEESDHPDFQSYRFALRKIK